MPEIQHLTVLLTATFGVTFDGDPQRELVWFDGPDVISVIDFLKSAGVSARSEPSGVQGYLFLDPRNPLVVTRSLRKRTAVLIALRPDEYHDDSLRATRLPAGGLTPRTPAEEVAVTLVEEHISDLPRGQVALLVAARTAIDAVGGADELRVLTELAVR
jgi:hypothetical protein